MDEEISKKYSLLLVAQFLKSNGYVQSLASFLRETSLPLSAVDEKTDEYRNTHLDDLETIIKERIEYSEHIFKDKLSGLSLNDTLQPFDTKYGLKSWDHSKAFKLNQGISTNGIPISCSFTKDDPMVAYSDKTVGIYDEHLNAISGSLKQSKNIIKFCGTLPGSEIIYTCSIDGKLTLYDKDYSLLPCGVIKVYPKMITHLQICAIDEVSWYVVSSGIGNILRIGTITVEKNNNNVLNEVSESTLMSACSSVAVAMKQVDNQLKPVIFLTRTDFTQITCYTLTNENVLTISCRIALNNAQFSAHSFNVRDISLINTLEPATLPILKNSTMLAVATSHIPYMRLILVKVPEFYIAASTETAHIYYDNILRNIATVIPQDSFSKPVIRYFPSCSGIIVGGDSALYAIDLEKAESWKLDLPGSPKDKRVKCVDVNSNGTELLTGTADKSIFYWATSE